MLNDSLLRHASQLKQEPGKKLKRQITTRYPLKIQDMEKTIPKKLAYFDHAIKDQDKIKAFAAKVTDVQKENFDVLGNRPLASYFKLTNTKEITITFTDNSLPNHIKNKIVALFFSIFC